jgi:hypothetical protein
VELYRKKNTKAVNAVIKDDVPMTKKIFFIGGIEQPVVWRLTPQKSTKTKASTKTPTALNKLLYPATSPPNHLNNWNPDFRFFSTCLFLK